MVPVYGCKNCLEDLVQRVSRSLESIDQSFEIILVDDSSPDDAWPRITELAGLYPQVRGLRLSRNFGQHAAISAGLLHTAGEVVVVMDCDLQDIPEEIPALLAAMEQKDVEVALGQRIDRQDSWFKKLGSKLFYQALGWLTDTRYDHTTANFGAYSRRVIDTVNRMPEQDRFFPLLVRWTGFRAAYVAVSHGQRSEGKSSYNFRTLVRLATRVALSFSDKPLRLVMKGALLLAAVSICIAGFSVYQYVAGNIRVAGFTSIVASIWLIGSGITFCLGVLGLYLGRLHDETKGRPQYIVWQDTRNP
ncbi:glycosyltransferase [Frateuria sp. Soil773]|nr:glycosyltransferase [Frateuria sp. Soil773]